MCLVATNIKANNPVNTCKKGKMVKMFNFLFIKIKLVTFNGYLEELKMILVLPLPSLTYFRKV